MKKINWALNTISSKLLILLMSVAITSTITVTFVFSAYELTTAKEEQVQTLQTLSKMLSPNITAAVLFDDQAAIQELINPILLRSDVVSVTVTNLSGEVLNSASQEAKSKNIVERQLQKITRISTPLTLEDSNYGHLQILADDSYIANKVGFYSQFITILLIFTFAISFLLSLFLRNKFLSPILHLANVAKEVTESNDYRLRAKELSDDEVGQLTSCFNGMLDTIEQRDNLLESQVKLRTAELETANCQLHEYAYLDGLTNLPNRRYFYEKIRELITQNSVFTLIFIDLDGFKEINDILGHDYGDLLLNQIGKRLRHSVREQDTVARLGGDEFTIILENINDIEQASQIAESIRASLMQRVKIKNEQVHVSGSIGLTFHHADGESIETLVKHADQAMYLAKNKGRNRYEFFSYEMEQKALEQHRLIEDIRIAVKEKQFEVYYQPIFNIDGTEVVKTEALVRWHHPTKGFLPPDSFIPTAESNGLISEIGDLVRAQAIIDSAEFFQLSGRIIPISVNVSPLQIDRYGKWVEQWILACNKEDLPPSAMVIEITENTLMDPESPIQQHLKRLNVNGISVAIDDFGVGYSSLAYLQRLDIDILKIDRSFVNDMEDYESSVELVKAIITMAHNLKVKVVAEGVETKMQHQLLQQLGCDYLQGYLFAKPMPKHEFTSKYLTGKTTNVTSIHKSII